VHPLWCLLLSILFGQALAGPQVDLCARGLAAVAWCGLGLRERSRRALLLWGILLGVGGGMRLRLELARLRAWDPWEGSARVQVEENETGRGVVWLRVAGRPAVRAVTSSLDAAQVGARTRVRLRSWIPPGRRNPDDSDRLRAGLSRPPILRVKFLLAPSWYAPPHAPRPGPRRWLRSRLRALLQERMGAGSALWCALLLGDRSGLSQAARERFAKLGLAHMLALSGLHVGLVAFLLLRMSGRSRQDARAWILLPLVAWALAAGLSPSLVRAVAILAWLMGGRRVGRPRRPVDALAAAGVLELVVRPVSITSLGWWLSYAATLALLRVASGLPRHRVLAAVLAVTVAPLGTLPWTLGVFGRLPWAAPLWNLAVGPLFAALMTAGLLLVASAVLLPAVAPLTLSVLALLSHAFGYVLRILEGLNPGALGHPGLHGWAWAAALGAVGLALLPDLGGSVRRRLGLVLGLLVLVHARVLVCPGERWWSLDVGQGDGGVLRVGRGSCLVIDCGNGPFHGGPERVILPYLARRNLRGVALLVTHGHRDHYGGAVSLLRSHRVNDLYLGRVERERSWTRPLLEAARAAEVRTHWIARGDTLKVGGWKLACLWPVPSAQSLAFNDRSVVLRGGPSTAPMLWTGDLELEAERKLLAYGDSLRCGVLKVAHHGSKTGTSARLLRCLGRGVALISCGVQNRYHHPHAATLNVLRAQGWTVLRTDRNGAVGVAWSAEGVRILRVRAAP
jgi:competence protein ComEC